MSPTTRKPSSVRRREIAEAALRVIGEHGATSLTAASLAAEVGLTAGALFRHFATLDDILGAAVDSAIEAVDATFPSGDLSPRERLRALALARVEVIGGTPGLAWLLLSDEACLCVPASAAERLRALVARSRAFILSELRAGVAGGELRADVDPETALPIFTGTVHALIVARGAHPSIGQAPPSRSAEHVVDTLITLFATP